MASYVLRADGFYWLPLTDDADDEESDPRPGPYDTIEEVLTAATERERQHSQGKPPTATDSSSPTSH